MSPSEVCGKKRRRSNSANTGRRTKLGRTGSADSDAQVAPRQESPIEFPVLSVAAEECESLRFWTTASMPQSRREPEGAGERRSISETTENISLSTWAAQGPGRGLGEPACSLQQWAVSSIDQPCKRLPDHLLEPDDEVADTATSSSAGDSDSGSYGSAQAASGEEGSLDSRRDFPASSDAFSFGLIATCEQVAGTMPRAGDSSNCLGWPFSSSLAPEVPVS